MYTQTPRAADTRLRESANGAARVVCFSARALIANAIGACPNNAGARAREARPATARADRNLGLSVQIYHGARFFFDGWPLSVTLGAADRPIERGTRAGHTANSARAVGSVVVPSGSIDGSSSALDLCSSTTKAAPTSQGGRDRRGLEPGCVVSVLLGDGLEEGRVEVAEFGWHTAVVSVAHLLAFLGVHDPDRLRRFLDLPLL